MTFKAKFTDKDLISFFKVGDVNSNQVKDFAVKNGVQIQSVTKRMNKLPQFSKVGRGKWNLTLAQRLEKTYNATTTESATIKYVPERDPNYVPFGNAPSLKKIIASRQFYPVFITGLSGNGKTLGVEQTCASLNRELIRVNITIETDEDDLIGGFRLVDGNTEWHNGPVIEALHRGSVLLLDEIDLASNKILCLQSILYLHGRTGV